MMGKTGRPVNRLSVGRKSKRLSSVQTISTPWRWGQVAALPLVLLLAYLDAKAPGVLSDLNALVLTADWHVTLAFRTGLVVLCVVAYFLIRAYHPLTGAALLLTILGQAMRLGTTQASEEPLTMGTLVLLVALAMIPARVIVRPNEADLQAHLDAQDAQEALP